MFKLKNGILYKNQKPVIAMGQSYYPSFHEKKYPLPPSGDRIALMKEDIQMMTDVGFQFLRVAALGDVRVNGDEIEVDTSFIDELLKEADRKGMATSVRLQGYVMNLRGHQDYLMRNADDDPMEKAWSSFIRNSLFHNGILKDNWDASQALACHFNTIPGVVSYQIYNEPHYPRNGIFDYHPKTLEAYKMWREENGLAPEDAPRRRPLPGESPDSWIHWRIFSMRAMSDFLNKSSAAVKEVSPCMETYTCMTAAPAQNDIMSEGIQYFDSGAGMDAVGITTYSHMEGVNYYTACYQYDMAECAAALYGKHAWTIEADARTHMPARKLHQQTYSLLAAGHKGIVYYEWRGDYPDKGTPLPDNCGFIFNDGTKTEHYDRSVEMVRFVNRHSTRFASAEKLRDGVAILCSDYAAAYGDAYLTDMGINIYVNQSVNVYRELRKCGITVDLVCAEHLGKNVLGTQVLFIPADKNWLSKGECEKIDAFVNKGGNVFYLRQKTARRVAPYGVWQWDEPVLNETTSEFRSCMEIEDVLEMCGIEAKVKVNNRHIKYGVLKGDNYALVVMTNTDPRHSTICGAVMKTSIPFEKASFISPDLEIELEVIGEEIKLPDIVEGGVVVLDKQ